MAKDKGDWGGARLNAGPPRTRWKNVLSEEARAALSVMGLQDAVRGRKRQDEAEIALVEWLILAERERRLAPKEKGMYPVKQTFRIVEIDPLWVRGEMCHFQVLRRPEDEDAEYVAAYAVTKEEAEAFVRDQGV